MKRIIKLTLFLLLIFNINSYSQDSRFHGFINLNSGHYTFYRQNNISTSHIYTGIESGIWFDITKNVSLGTGINFLKYRSSEYTTSTVEYWELSTPFLTKFSTSGKKVKFFAITGIYIGGISYSKHISYNTKFQYSYWEIREESTIPDIKADLIICPGIEYQVSNNFGISFSPFMKYRFLDTYDENNPLFYGLKIGARFSIKENEDSFRNDFLSKTHLIVRAGINHFSFPGNNSLKIDTSLYYSFPLDPCLEINVAYDFDRFNSIGTGINFQSVRLANGKSYYNFREVSFPLYYTLNIFSNKKLYSFISAGMPFGLKTYWEEYSYKYNDQGEKVSIPEGGILYYTSFPYISKYNVKNGNFIDLFIEPGVKYVISNNLLLQASPSLKFRIKDQFFEDTNSFSIGLKAGVQFSFD